jgi:hypothetical protein
MTRVVMCFALLAAGCASLGAQRAREKRLKPHLTAFRFVQPVDDVWQEGRRLLAERGYPLAPPDALAVGQKPMGWVERITSPARATSEQGASQRSLDTGWTTARARYHMEGRRDAGGWRVTFTRLTEDFSDRQPTSTADLELELALVRRLDPAEAARIEGALAASER